MYPNRYQLPELTAHVIALLERRRPGFSEWNADVEAKLIAEAKDSLAEAGKQFSEVSDDAGYWKRMEEGVLEVALPRYFQLAKEQHAAEKNRFWLWRGGDLVSRAAYAAVGVVLAAVVWRTAIPDWIEPLPVLMILFGPMIPDAQTWFARRKYAARLAHLVQDMQGEQQQRAQYRPLMDVISPVSAEPPKVSEPDKERG